MSIKGDIFKAIGQHLMDKLQFSNNHMPSLQWFDKDFGQADLIKEGIVALPMPAALISFRTPNWSSALSGVQQGSTTIRVRILWENYADSFQGSINQDKAIQFFEFNELAHKALQGFSGEFFSGLDRNADDEDDDHTNVVITDMFYATIITDDSSDNTGFEPITDPLAKTTQTEPVRPDSSTNHAWVIPN
jgi:hypothetical protein